MCDLSLQLSDGRFLFCDSVSLFDECVCVCVCDGMRDVSPLCVCMCVYVCDGHGANVCECV